MSDTVNQTPNKKAPDVFVHVKVPYGQSDKIGSRIGVGFFHRDGVGMNLILDAQPIPKNGQIELVCLPPKT